MTNKKENKRVSALILLCELERILIGIVGFVCLFLLRQILTSAYDLFLSMLTGEAMEKYLVCFQFY